MSRPPSSPSPSSLAVGPAEDAILDGVANLVVVVDPDGRIERFNRACESATGRPRQAVIGMAFAEVFPPANPERVRGAAGTAIDAETTCGEGPGAARRIAWRRVAVAVAVAVADEVRPDGGTGRIVCTGTDVTERRAAERAANDREQLYRNIVETAHEGVWVIDAAGRTLYANPRIAEILGYAPHEMLGVNVFDCMAPSLHAAFRARMERRKRGETQTLEWPCRRRDGSQRWTMVTSSPMLDQDGRLIGLLGMITDISEQRRVAEALRESEERFRLAVEHSPDTMFFQDTDLRVTWVSRTAPPLTPADFVGKTDAELVGPAEAARIGAIKRRVLATGTSERTEIEFVAGDVHLFLDVVYVRRTDGEGRVLGLAGYARDVTARREVETALANLNQTLERRVDERTESLRFSEERFRLIVEQAPVSIQILSPDGRTLQVNDAFRRLFGVGAEELAGYNILADPQLEVSGAAAPIRRAFAGETAYVPPVRYVPDRGPLLGQERWAQALMYPVKDASGDVREVVIVHEDVTDRHRAEALLRESERHYRDVAERNRLLVQEVEHRVGNNLAGLLGLVTIMRNRVRDVDAFAASIENRLRAMTRVHRMLVGSGWRAVTLRDLVGTVLGGMGQMAPCAAAEQVAGPDLAVPPKLALPLMLILAEWHTNSCKYGAHSTPGGTLDVAWDLTGDPASDARRVRLTWTERGGPPIRQPVIPSVGTELVHAFAARELQGACAMRFPTAGAEHTIEFVVPG